MLEAFHISIGDPYSTSVGFVYFCSFLTKKLYIATSLSLSSWGFTIPALFQIFLFSHTQKAKHIFLIVDNLVQITEQICMI